LITVKVDRGYIDLDWNQYFTDTYSGIVESYKSVQLSVIDEKDVVMADQLSGICSGSPRVFVREGDNVYQIALQYSGEMSKQEAESIFYSFLAEFSY